MSAMLQYIDDYFTGQLPAEEKQRFAKRCENDTDFAQEVANYISVRNAVKEQLLTNMQSSRLVTGLHSVAQKRNEKSVVIRMIPYLSAVAACLLLYFGWLFLFKPAETTQIAANYIDANFQTLSVTMGDNADSLQLGIAAFNDKDYQKAENIFLQLSKSEPDNAEVIKNIGILYLVQKRYELALTQFEQLSRFKDLYYNPGPLYKAVTLMKRASPGDREQAKKLLEEIQASKMYGSNEATEWLKAF